MASLPPQSTSPQRRRSIQPGQSTSHSPRHESPSRTGRRPSTTSEDSQTVFLNSPPTSKSPIPDQQQEKPTSARDPVPSTDDNAEPRKCWICFTDETEDTPASSAWRSPCPCALVAHESCLLDWVADLEAPNSRKRATSNKILCPQCKSEIVVARPRSLTIEVVNAIERITGRLVVPGLVLTLMGTVYTGCLVHGLSTIYTVFGVEDAQRILDDIPKLRAWKLFLGVPSIPVLLILARTRIADNLLPVIPIVFLAAGHQTLADFDLWPPSAAMTIAALPYIRGAYNIMYDQIFGERERRWLKEIQPRAGENDTDPVGGPAEQGANDGRANGHQAVLMELDLEVEVFEDDAEGGNEHIPQPQAPGNQDGAPQNQQQGANLNALAPRQNNMVITTSHLADTILGALIFPSVSAAIGAMLKAALPQSWTTVPISQYRGRSGLLQTRWGRTIIGGCLFVVLKDTVFLYSRWKLAQSHRKRRILDYDRTKKRVVDR